MKLAEAMNTYNMAIYEINSLGYSVSTELDNAEEEITSWTAQKDNVQIYAFSPLSLLALTTIAEKYGENWRNIETGHLYDKALD